MEKKNTQAGYSIVELIITIIIVGVAFPGLIGFITGSMTDTVKTECISKAIIMAGQKMEEICADKNEPARGMTYITTPGQYPAETLDQFTRTVAVQNIIFDNINVAEVTVSVSHPAMDGPYMLNHLFTDYNGN